MFLKPSRENDGFHLDGEILVSIPVEVFPVILRDSFSYFYSVHIKRMSASS